MKTVVLGARPPELQALIDHRQALGLDTYDEEWEGEYHMAPAAHSAHGYLDNVLAELLGPLARTAGLVGVGPFNLGRPGDYRVPDRGYLRAPPRGVWLPTAAVVVEIVSPDDESFAKFGFYARHRVDEILTVDSATRTVQWWARQPDESGYDEIGASTLLGLTATDLATDIDWPDIDWPDIDD